MLSFKVYISNYVILSSYIREVIKNNLKANVLVIHVVIIHIVNL